MQIYMPTPDRIHVNIINFLSLHPVIVNTFGLITFMPELKLSNRSVGLLIKGEWFEYEFIILVYVLVNVFSGSKGCES